MTHYFLSRKAQSAVLGIASVALMSCAPSAKATEETNFTPLATRLYRIAERNYKFSEREAAKGNPLQVTQEWKALSNLAAPTGLNKNGNQSALHDMSVEQFIAAKQLQSKNRHRFNVKIANIRFYLKTMQNAGRNDYLDKLYFAAFAADLKLKPANQP